MGDRANIAIEQGDGTRVWLYTHWRGSELPATLQAALRRGEDRWCDGPYLARIIFEEMIRGDQGSLTGFGITTSEADNDGYPILVVDPDKAQVTLEPDGKEFTFERYCSMPDGISWEHLA